MDLGLGVFDVLPDPDVEEEPGSISKKKKFKSKSKSKKFSSSPSPSEEIDSKVKVTTPLVLPFQVGSEQSLGNNSQDKLDTDLLGGCLRLPGQDESDTTLPCNGITVL